MYLFSSAYLPLFFIFHLFWFCFSIHDCLLCLLICLWINFLLCLLGMPNDYNLYGPLNNIQSLSIPSAFLHTAIAIDFFFSSLALSLPSTSSSSSSSSSLLLLIISIVHSGSGLRWCRLCPVCTALMDVKRLL
jgi:hypothetical protein